LPSPDPVTIALHYHERTKHHPFRYARSLGYLDWDSQPDPFRRFEGARLVPLPRPASAEAAPPGPLVDPLEEARLDASDTSPPYDTLFAGGPEPPRPLSGESLSELLFFSLALSAWKSIPGATWSLRVNPSSGNLHPTEATVVAPEIPGLTAEAGVFHYAPREHALEERTRLAPGVHPGLVPGHPGPFLLLGLSSIHWRESWKYGERAYRYCQHDVGHAIASVRFAAALLGWTVRLVPASSAAISRLLGLDRATDFPAEESEEADVLLVIDPRRGSDRSPVPLARDAAETVARGTWHGRASTLSTEHHEWPVIDEVARACASPLGSFPLLASPPSARPGPDSWPLVTTTGASAARILRQRRSAVAMDGASSLSRERFLVMLGRLVPALCPAPWDVAPVAPILDLVLFLHRVDGLEPGTYLLVRDAARAEEVRELLAKHLGFEPIPGAPPDLPLYRLFSGEVQSAAAAASCHQDIARDGAFAVSMVAPLGPLLREHGAPLYRHIHHESGMIGQVLYLEAEAAGLRSTGIGCFFDEAVTGVLGAAGNPLAAIYHFTVGGAVEDERLSTHPAYPA